MEGLINDKIEGENGFGYDQIFYFPPCKMTSAMMSMEEKNQYSHQSKSFKKIIYDFKGGNINESYRFSSSIIPQKYREYYENPV